MNQPFSEQAIQRLRRADVIVSLVVLAIILNGEVLRDKQWDVEVYYFGGLASRLGLSPYRLDDLNRAAAPAGIVLKWPLLFMYSPLVVGLFKPLSLLSLVAAKHVWMALKIGTVLSLAAIWRRWFIGRPVWIIATVLLVTGFNRALDWDLKSGNFSLFEELLLWLGLAAWIVGRPRLFATLIVVAGLFKLTPLFLLALLLLGERRPRVEIVVASVCGFALLMWLSHLLWPGDTHLWLVNIGHHDEENAPNNPCFLSLLRDVAALAEPGSLRAVAIANAVFVTVSATMSAVLVSLSMRGNREDNRWRLAYLASFLLALPLILPRFMSYTYVLLLAPTYLVLMRSRTRLIVAGVCIVGLTILSAGQHGFSMNPEPGIHPNGSDLLISLTRWKRMFVGYAPALTAAALWLLSVKDLRRFSRDDTGRASRPAFDPASA